jgi:putative Ca2+/H+ antiporter (TMEM165/GDT1 family)
MDSSTHNRAAEAPWAPGEVFLFGVPIGGLGWFATILMGTAAGFIAFFAGTFLGIIGITIADAIGHGGIDYAISYRWVGFPLGVVVMLLSLALLITLRVRRSVRRSR